MRSLAPGWKGTLPEGVTKYKSSTSIVWLLGRIYCTGTPEDNAAVHALQDEFKLVPLSAYGKPYTPSSGRVDPSLDMATAVRDQVNRMDAVSYFTLLSELMKTNPPSSADAAHVARFKRIGIVPGEDFDPRKLKADFSNRVPKTAVDRIMQHYQTVKNENGWSFTTNTGVYGTGYLMRAVITAIGLGANRPQDAIYPISKVDAEGRQYNGSNKYVMRFAKGDLPPVEGFWSLTMDTSSSTIRSTDIRSVHAKTCRSTRMDRPISTYRRSRPARIKSRIGFLPLPVNSS